MTFNNIFCLFICRSIQVIPKFLLTTVFSVRREINTILLLARVFQIFIKWFTTNIQDYIYFIILFFEKNIKLRLILLSLIFSYDRFALIITGKQE